MKDGVKLLQIGNSCLTIKTKKEMKKNLFMVAAVALMALVSCSKEDFNNGVQSGASDIVFSAELEQPAGLPAAEPAEIQSKTSLGTAVNGVRPVSWVKDDQIKINGVTFKAASAGSRTDFTPTGSFNPAATYYAVYPATATSKADHSAITIPASQDGSFAKAAISVAKSSTQSLSFKNVASIIKFSVPANCSTVTISSDQNLAGTFPVTFENNLPKIGTVSSASKTITLTGSFTTSGEYYVAVLPGDHTFTMRIDGYLSKASTKAVTTTRAKIANLKTLPALQTGSFKIMGIGSDWNTGKTFYKDVDGYLLKNVSITSSTEFKFVSGTQWCRSITTCIGRWAYLYEGDGNLKSNDFNGTYDIYASTEKDMVCIVKAGAAKPTFDSANKLFHLVLEGYDDCGLYMWEPAYADNWDAAWNNYQAKVKFRKDNTDWKEFCVFTMPTNAIDKQCKFLFKWYNGKSCDYTKVVNDDLPFWRNGGNDGAYGIAGKIAIN